MLDVFFCNVPGPAETRKTARELTTRTTRTQKTKATEEQEATRHHSTHTAKIAKIALKNNTTLKYETLKMGLISEKDYNKIVDPKKMIYPE